MLHEITRKLHKRTMVLFLLVAILLSGYASAATDTFNEYTKDSHFIASRGTFTDKADLEWKNTIVDCWASFPYSYSYYKFDKALYAFASNNEFIIVELKSEYKGDINDSRIDKLYQKIEAHCEENTGLNEVPVVFMWAEDEEDLVFEYDPDAFEKAKNNSDFIVSWGIVPTFTDENERLQWSESVLEARYIDKLQPYIGGPVIFYGFVENNAYIEVGINKNTLEKVNDSMIEEIYQIIDKHYEENGINAIPVVFTWSEPFELSVATLNETPKWMEDNITNLSTEGRVNATKINETSGFTSIMLVLCLLILIKARK